MNATTLIQPTSDAYRTVELDVEADRAAIIDVDEWAFAVHHTAETYDQLAFPLESGRTVGIRHAASGELAAIHSSYAFSMNVPGGSLPTAGLTWVGVHPGHRRKGLATAMLATHLRRTAERGEPLSALFAAEAEIYGRYGYGLAALSARATLPRGVALREVPGSEGCTVRLEKLDPARHRDVVLDIQRAVTRPGAVTPPTEALLTNLLVDVEAFRDGAELRRIAIVSDPSGTPTGFAIFRRKADWVATGPAGTVRVALSHTLDGPSTHALWDALTHLDLMATIETGVLAVDDRLFPLLVNVRSARTELSDNVWVRVVDIRAALEGRAYAAPVDVVLGVRDELLPENAGTWRLVAGTSGASLTRTDASADVELDVRELGAAYLGGVQLATLGAAGLVRETAPGALLAASRAFSWHEAPACSWGF